MPNNKHFIKGIPLVLWHEYTKACLFFNITIKDHLISCMQSLIIRYLRELEERKTGPIYKHSEGKKK